MARYILIALIAVALIAGCPKKQVAFEIGEAVLADGRVSVEIKQGEGQRVGIGILLVEDSPFLTGGDPLEAELVQGGLRVSGGPVRVIYGEIKREYFSSSPESCVEIGQLGRNRTTELPKWVVQAIRDTGLKCVFVTEGAGTKDSPRAQPSYWLRPIRIAEDEQAPAPAAGDDAAGAAAPDQAGAPEQSEAAEPADPAAGEPAGE